MTEQELSRMVDIAFQKGMEDAKRGNLIVKLPNGFARLVAYNPDPEKWECYAILADKQYRYYVYFDKVIAIRNVYWDDYGPVLNFPNKYDVEKQKITSLQIEELEKFIAEKDVTNNFFKELNMQQEREKRQQERMKRWQEQEKKRNEEKR